MQVRPFTWLALSFFGYYCAYGVFLPLFPAWLKTQSYSEESIGLLLACAYIFRFSGGILFSGLIKRVFPLSKWLTLFRCGQRHYNGINWTDVTQFLALVYWTCVVFHGECGRYADW